MPILKLFGKNLIREDQSRCSVTLDLKTLREKVQLDRVYVFLAGLDDVFDKFRSDILRTQPLPSVEEVFSVVRREAQRHATMMGRSATGNQGGTFPLAMVSRPTGFGWPYGLSSSTDSRPVTRENKDDLKCTFFGQTRHMEDTCFQKHGVLEWFSELKKKLRSKERASSGANGMRPLMAATTTGNKDAMPTQGDPSQALLTQLNPSELSSNTGTDGCGLLASGAEHHLGWILDSGATDHMPFDKRLFKYMTMTYQKCVATANGTTTVVTGTGIVDLTPSLSLHHYLLVPSLSHHLLSIPQVTEQLDCVVIMYPFFCLLQDIQTNEIIGRGTKREGLYYVDDIVPGRANAVRVSRTSNLQEV